MNAPTAFNEEDKKKVRQHQIECSVRLKMEAVDTLLATIRTEAQHELPRATNTINYLDEAASKLWLAQAAWKKEWKEEQL